MSISIRDAEPTLIGKSFTLRNSMATRPRKRITATIKELRQIEPRLGPVARWMAATVRSTVAGGSRSLLEVRSDSISVYYSHSGKILLTGESTTR